MFASTVFCAVVLNICIDLCFFKLFEMHEFIATFKEEPSTIITLLVMWLLCHLVYYFYHKDGRVYIDD